MSNQHAFSVSKPISGWNKPLKINYRSLFIALGKALAQGAVGAGTANPVAIGNAIKEVMGAFSAFEKVALTDFVDEPGQIGWVLIHRSLLGAMEALMIDHADLFTETPDPEAFAETLDLTLEETEVRIDESLFSRPKALPILEAYQTLFAEWLEGCGLDKAQANAIADRLPTHFVSALHHEWARRPSDYAGLKAALTDSPFMKASAREEAWRQYRALLQKQVDERMFDEAFSLRQVYVPLRAYYEEKEKGDALDGEAMGLSHQDKANKKKVVVWLAETLNDWLQQADCKDAIRIISGGPGCGKSSFTKMWAANLADNGALSVLHVPLHHLGLSDDLEESIGDFVRDADILPTNPLHADEGEPRLLIIFESLMDWTSWRCRDE